MTSRIVTCTMRMMRNSSTQDGVATDNNTYEQYDDNDDDESRPDERIMKSDNDSDIGSIKIVYPYTGTNYLNVPSDGGEGRQPRT